eukprot:jgi/Mesvir1/14285/Mv09715-RA.1
MEKRNELQAAEICAMFSLLSDDDLSYFKGLLGCSGVVVDKDELTAFNEDWMGKYRGYSKLALKPKTTQQVAEVLKYCNQRRLAVVPQGGNTGLVGGSTPVHDEIVLSLSHMNAVESLDVDSGALVCGAGAILENLDRFAATKGFMMPLDLGAKGTCQIGGNVSTNAGGVRLLRYGSLHGTVLGLEVVLANGTILDMLSSLRKDNTGYDMKQLFIGAEGTLGVVTRVCILCPPRPPAVNVAFLACPSYGAVLQALHAARAGLGEVLSAFELIDRQSLQLVVKQLGMRDPLPDAPQPFYVLIETQGSNDAQDKEKLDLFLEKMLEEETVVDGTIAASGQHMQEIWRLRESIAEALQKAGVVYKYDLSLPVGHLYDLVEEMRARLAGSANVVGYGHLGDGNLHLNISAPAYDQQLLARIEPFVYEWTRSQKGSVSAEHGLGLMKANKIHYSKPPDVVRAMKSLKKLFDPNGILNPYKVLPDEVVA